MTALICLSIATLTILCVAVFVCVYIMIDEELSRRDAIDAEKNKREMGL